jgi:DNA-binding NarL/FixJ family response regulator
MPAIKIILADDHTVLRTGLKLLINNQPDFVVVGEAADGQALLELLERVEADVLVLDLSMPLISGLECVKEIRSRKYDVKILVLTMHGQEYVKEAIASGAMGYIEKQALDSELFVAIKTVFSGKRYMSQDNASLLLDQLLLAEPEEKSDDPYVILSSREREVLKLLVRGHSLTQIAAILHLSVKTIDTHKTHLMEKLNVTHKSQLVEYALKHGLLSKRGAS